MAGTYLQIEVCEEALLTDVASEALVALVDLYVFVQVRSLSEPMVTVREVASVRSLICVDAQVVKEIVPFPEPLVAVGLIAFEHLDEALRLRVFVGEDAVGFGIRHMLFDLHSMQIEGLP